MEIQLEVLQSFHQSYAPLCHQKWNHDSPLQIIVYPHLYCYPSIQINTRIYLLLIIF